MIQGALIYSLHLVQHTVSASLNPIWKEQPSAPLGWNSNATWKARMPFQFITSINRVRAMHPKAPIYCKHWSIRYHRLRLFETFKSTVSQKHTCSRILIYWGALSSRIESFQIYSPNCFNVWQGLRRWYLFKQYLQFSLSLNSFDSIVFPRALTKTVQEPPLLALIKTSRDLKPRSLSTVR